MVPGTKQVLISHEEYVVASFVGRRNISAIADRLTRIGWTATWVAQNGDLHG